MQQIFHYAEIAAIFSRRTFWNVKISSDCKDRALKLRVIKAHAISLGLSSHCQVGEKLLPEQTLIAAVLCTLSLLELALRDGQVSLGVEEKVGNGKMIRSARTCCIDKTTLLFA